MLKKLKIGAKLQVGFYLLVLLVLIGFTERQMGVQTVTDVVIHIENNEEHQFLTEEEVLRKITLNNRYELKGETVENIDLKTIEKRLKKDRFVKEARVFRDLEGVLTIELEQRNPIARVLLADSSVYIGEEGVLLPLSSIYTARVPLVMGEGAKEIFSSDVTMKDSLMSMFNFILRDRFLRSQVAQVEINKKGDLELFMQMSKQKILFGQAQNFKNKFKRVKVFYDRILPLNGYNHYETVNVKFDNQIVCE